mmetsp:Transcript_23090/g.34698  ORF Transcript_23090/g.34698 Transcript_23090/m.34698 type:complete len:302 (+) Transcript_23090:84-989(+)
MAEEYLEKINEMGGRKEYQRASEVSTSFHSTSKWVLGVLGRIGWLDGVVIKEKEEENPQKEEGEKKKKKLPRRNVNLLEVGAINTQLLDAAARTKKVKTQDTTDTASLPTAQTENEDGDSIYKDIPVHKLTVRAIDLRSSHPGIETQDFLTLPLQSTRYDVIVCSMVINCVPTPESRGKMLCLLYHQLRPGGLCFLTLPKLCLSQSPHISKEMFQEMLSSSKEGNGVGFEIVETKESPKVAFFVLSRPLNNDDNEEKQRKERNKVNPKFTRLITINRGKKYRNKFAIVLKESEVFGDFLNL